MLLIQQIKYVSPYCQNAVWVKLFSKLKKVFLELKTKKMTEKQIVQHFY